MFRKHSLAQLTLGSPNELSICYNSPNYHSTLPSKDINASNNFKSPNKGSIRPTTTPLEIFHKKTSN